ncbi:hypothetical protein NEFER03_1326 [Nematocida sp. LUAm3]|nr:hypothetical protein NEFER03_1326 [Nematocida sp. LUAm3]KAI5174052.1 hypothetical protein NEFER02_0519 [Nematocida sp. LUAm2]KAI5177205.1 hypothetical protein NEFER01_0480 [Nematocida sp. LUAm1]
MLLLNFVIASIYWFGSQKPIETIQLEIGIKSIGSTNSKTFLSHVGITSLFMAMVFSTAVNSKSKFTMKISFFCGIIYCIFITGLFIYFKLQTGKSAIESIHFQKSNINAADMFISVATELQSKLGSPVPIVTMQSAASFIIDYIQVEIYRILLIIGFSMCVSILSTLLLLVCINTKVSDRKEELIKECEVKTRSVGFNTPISSLRTKK